MANVQFQDFLDETSLLIKNQLDIFLNRKIREVKDLGTVPIELVKKLSSLTSRGKMIRAALIRIGFELAGGSNLTEIIKVAASYEILHTFLLIHDDIIDKANLRRGLPTIHYQFSKYHKEQQLRGNSLDYGEAVAITVGDIANFFSFGLFLESNFPDQYKIGAVEFLTKTLIETGWGQILDIDLALRTKRDEEDVFKIYELKTASYSLVAPLVIGAILAGADRKIQENLANFARPLGIAFQIKDDILGTFGGEEITGKNPKLDIEEGKNTLLISYALRRANKKEREFLSQFYGRKPVTNDILDKIRNIFVRSGALSYSERKIDELIGAALVELQKLPSTPQTSLLASLTNFLAERDR
ncbi:MAG: polyprenyl synthetase family protein [Nitrososphaerota archaeon]